MVEYSDPIPKENKGAWKKPGENAQQARDRMRAERAQARARLVVAGEESVKITPEDH
ncbi:hypothetical protein K6V98_00160 [Collinsella sp. AGMB00827]|uniref:Uncharacterized protein n=1 Tax=Collinsella ureilytica TaxID=2869515 RepID=A0ABS7MHK6_9ACTN|nr:hypothetical protein [Collinsella urealyticum]MBY4796783.1 hypothetical protein [Collinsella urealyticum]